ncbi:unnamed protein product [Ilex paraguariensis]|uniref:Uncharacterized protein n=1 Tax=Ilex paraguariensis TaxID=185542 RepID=A0ABC8STF7_9AQUA
MMSNLTQEKVDQVRLKKGVRDSIIYVFHEQGEPEDTSGDNIDAQVPKIDKLATRDNFYGSSRNIIEYFDNVGQLVMGRADDTDLFEGFGVKNFLEEDVMNDKSTKGIDEGDEASKNSSKMVEINTEVSDFLVRNGNDE